MVIDIKPKDKEIHLYTNSITKDEIRQYQSCFKDMSDYEIIIHNPQQVENLIDVYEGNINIQNLGNGK